MVLQLRVGIGRCHFDMNSGSHQPMFSDIPNLSHTLARHAKLGEKWADFALSGKYPRTRGDRSANDPQQVSQLRRPVVHGIQRLRYVCRATHSGVFVASVVDC